MVGTPLPARAAASEPAFADFYRPDSLRRNWGLATEAQALSLEVGASAVLWSNEDVKEIVGHPPSNVDRLSFHLRPAAAEIFVDGRILPRRRWVAEGLQIVPAGLPSRSVFLGPVRHFQLFFSHSALARIADASPAGLELRDPLGERDQEAAQCCRRMMAELASGDRLSRLHFETLAISLAVTLIRRWSNAAPAAAGPMKGGLAPARLRRVQEFIQANLAEDLGLQTLAALAELSPKHFARAFRQSTGLPPHQWVVLRRVERAQALLATGSATAEIALACGFADQSHLTTTFRKVVGTTPARWRAGTR